ncbi:methylcoclaurine 3'-hydroxylase isozyme 1 [Seminavis robusta]|uniref:Methylcoclaurine 3'-hydroxylase isozyme 1 n=1 Tax=Seminavis robusta TaxID=568900 RepID=A0A9N8DQW2_9STRA|nr:methylcoclaurine 3'-hydroxylase isozyme 1 [Seminavis robusta]|eukprot:Sro274_g105580.1 methylcoclaurine 3'-hydroxylase isozyme 1 (455) ;mRNA; f:72777-74141
MMRANGKDDKKKKWVPMAPVGILECISEIGGEDAPTWLHRIAKKMGRNTFRLPLPMSLKGGFVVGNGKLASEIHRDPASDKPTWLYKPFTVLCHRPFFGIRSSFHSYTRLMRKNLATAYSKAEVERMGAVTDRLAEEWMTGRLARLAEQDEAFDPGQEFNRIAFFSICESGFQYTPTEEEYLQYNEYLSIALKEFFQRQMVSPWRGLLGKLLPEVRKAHESIPFIHEFAAKLLENYRQNPNNKATGCKTLIQVIDEVTPDDDDDLKVAEIIGQLIAGHETTGYSISNMSILLTKNPSVQEKLRKEMQQSDANPYYQHVIKETMRMVPVAAITSTRLTGREFVCPDDGTVIPKGAVCFLNQYEAGRDPVVYPNPEEFSPERWEDPTEAMKTNHFPFSSGYRQCPGQRLALANLNRILPQVLRSYSLELEDEGHLSNFVTYKYVGARIKARKLADA